MMAKEWYARRDVQGMKTTLGFSEAGRVYILVNTTIYAGSLLRRAFCMFPEAAKHTAENRKNEDIAELNSMLCVATVSLLSVLDAFANLCYDLHETPAPCGRESIQFRSHSFTNTKNEWVRSYQTKLEKDILFSINEGKPLNFFDLANFLKHELPWIGLVQCPENPEKHEDVYDTNNRGLKCDVLCPVHKMVVSMLCTLAKDLGISCDKSKFIKL